jgi:hypothetical protein
VVVDKNRKAYGKKFWDLIIGGKEQKASGIIEIFCH